MQCVRKGSQTTTEPHGYLFTQILWIFVQADSINPFRILWIVDCETARGDWMMKLSGVTEKLTPGVSQKRPEDFDKHTNFCGRFHISTNDM